MAEAAAIDEASRDALHARRLRWRMLLGFLSGLVIGLVVLHVAAIIYYRFAKRQNLVTAMLTGDKTLEVALTASRDGVADRLKALLVLALAAGVVWWVVSLGGAKP